MAVFGLPGGAEIWIILAVVLIIFGPTQLPKLAKMFGKSAKSLKEGMEGKLEDEDEKKPVSDDAKVAAESKKDDAGSE
ncbi:MAG: twin-arginine translocase TatA/TatE family subunit [Coriobacteriia bacterium]|nr:twin-arginine translocase TatA/TatE family subunit [Coriobacteriia bacterium]